MDRITKKLLDEFVQAHGFAHLAEEDQFERFAAYCTVSREYSETFNVEDITTGGDGDAGLDAVATIVNGNLVTSEEEIADLAELNGYVEADFIFVQAKRSSSFSAADVGEFGHAVRDFFSEEPTLIRNDRVKQAAALQEVVYDRSAQFRRGRPDCKLYYVTTGRWVDDETISARLAQERADLEERQIFAEVSIVPIGAAELQGLYHATRNRVSADFTFEKKILLPETTGVREAYLGVLPVSEYLKLITDAAGNIRKSLFYDNVRDFQPYDRNPVNRAIKSTLEDRSAQQYLPLLNNGVTVVAKQLQATGNRMHIEDYQIVNGCQTSHVLFDERLSLDPSAHVPMRLIVTEDEQIATSITTATNSQTEVKSEDLHALTTFQKRLETHFQTYEGKQALYYERRSQQYSGVAGIEKVRLVTRSQLIRLFAAMFLDQPHKASRYYAALKAELGKQIFGDDHVFEPYYVAAYAAYRLEYLFRNGVIDGSYRPFRYQLLMILRYQLAGAEKPPMNSRRMPAYVKPVMGALGDDEDAATAFTRAAAVIDGLEVDPQDRDRIRSQRLTDQVLAALGVNPPRDSDSP